MKLSNEQLDIVMDVMAERIRPGGREVSQKEIYLVLQEIDEEIDQADSFEAWLAIQ